MPDIAFNHFTHIIKRIESEAQKAGYLCIITDSNDDYENEKECLEHLVDMHVDGIAICLSQETTDYSHLQYVRQQHIPLVLFDRAADTDISSVVINDADSARQATHYLIDGGARRIAFLGGSNYGEYERVHYYYILDGVDDNWIDAGNGHVANYANVPSGSYTFRVRTSDSVSDEGGSEERIIKVVVASAPAFAWWAWLIYLTIASALAWYLYQNARRVVIARRAARQAQMEKEQELRTNQMNMSFFANIAHEFRTPLTMIAGPVGQLAKSESIDGEQRGLLNIAQRSIQRMFKLVNQLMDFNKLENDTLRLSVEQIDVVRALNEICDTFEFNVREKGLTLNRYGMEDSLKAWTDGDKLEKIVSNLLSNALKFTSSGGHIDVTLDVADNKVKVAVVLCLLWYILCVRLHIQKRNVALWMETRLLPLMLCLM